NARRRARERARIGDATGADDAPRRLIAGAKARDAHDGYAAPRTRRLRRSARARVRTRETLGIARAPPRALETWPAVRATVRPRFSISEAGSPARSPPAAGCRWRCGRAAR